MVGFTVLPTTTPPLSGNYPRYPAFGTGFTAGQTGPVTYRGSLIPNASVATYPRPGPSGFVR